MQVADNTVYISLGSNLNEPKVQLRQAITELRALDSSSVYAISSLYQSYPVGTVQQPDYLNAVVCMYTRLSPWRLLDKLQQIEQLHGRERKQRWAARTLDLDILLYADQTIADQHLQIPHPELGRRNFVLLPLFELQPQLHIPDMGPIQQLLAACPSNPIEKIAETDAWC